MFQLRLSLTPLSNRFLSNGFTAMLPDGRDHANVAESAGKSRAPLASMQEARESIRASVLGVGRAAVKLVRNHLKSERTRQRMRHFRIVSGLLFAVFGIILFAVFAWKRDQAYRFCASVAGECVWDRTRNRFYFENGFAGPHTCGFDKQDALDVSNCGLEVLSPGLLLYSNLARLDLGSNKLTELPSEVSTLRKLSYLDLSDNLITRLQYNVADMPSLKALIVRGNPVAASLSWSGLNLTKLPSTFQIAALDLLPSLRSLDLSCNRFDSAVFSKLSVLHSLTALDLSKNQIRNIDAGLQLSATLRKLNVSANLIVEIPLGFRDRFSDSKTSGRSDSFSLDLSSNGVESISKESAQEYQSTDLRLFNNPVRTIAWDYSPDLRRIPEWICDLTNLTQATIAVGDIEALLPYAFSTLSQLTLLHLGNNQIATISSDAFQGLGALQRLHLNDNARGPLRRLEVGTFRDLSSLTRLQLSTNQFLSDMTADTFLGLTKLQLLELDGAAALATARGQEFMFAHLSSLTKLVLAHSCRDFAGIARSGADGCEVSKLLLSNLTALRELDLGGSVLTRLGEGCFESLSNLSRLVLSNNALRNLPPQTFAGLSNLQYLGLGRNRLSSLEPSTFAPLGQLQHLRLNDNPLEELPSSAFLSLASLRTLQLQRCNLTDLSTSFSSLPALEEVYLYSNSISQIDELLFSGSLHLRRVELQRNKLKCIPFEPLAKLTALSALIIYGNLFEASSSADDIYQASCTPLDDLAASESAERLAGAIVSTSRESHDHFICPSNFSVILGSRLGFGFEMSCSGRTTTTTTSPCTQEQLMSVVIAKDAVSAVMELMGIAPICGSCFMGCSLKQDAEKQACAMACAAQTVVVSVFDEPVCMCEKELESIPMTKRVGVYQILGVRTGCSSCDSGDSDGMLILPEVQPGCPSYADCSVF
jgi:Leucine-rich repeat (LRR) protein